MRGLATGQAIRKYISKTLNKGDVSSSSQEHSSGIRTTSWAWQSDLGFAELLLASSLAHVMVDKWYFYFQGIALRAALSPSRSPMTGHQRVRPVTCLSSC